MQKPWTNAVRWLAPYGLLSLLPRDDVIHSKTFTNQDNIHRLAYRLILRRHFLNWDVLFPDTSMFVSGWQKQPVYFHFLTVTLSILFASSAATLVPTRLPHSSLASELSFFRLPTQIKDQWLSRTLQAFSTRSLRKKSHVLAASGHGHWPIQCEDHNCWITKSIVGKTI